LLNRPPRPANQEALTRRMEQRGGGWRPVGRISVNPRRCSAWQEETLNRPKIHVGNHETHAVCRRATSFRWLSGAQDDGLQAFVAEVETHIATTPAIWPRDQVVGPVIGVAGPRFRWNWHFSLAALVGWEDCGPCSGMPESLDPLVFNRRFRWPASV
jgi:hypothetical protein